MLDRARNEIDANSASKSDYEEYGNNILTQAIITILITAPLGAILINSLGVRWLQKQEDPSKIHNSNETNMPTKNGSKNPPVRAPSPDHSFIGEES
eukprot:CAMPEP_0168351500 /NCGR_PEP_ID=MMETSP0213-20121227/21910_1 /TAXON_ID=151035 /ORGANISM="Euplotes harpa, Strain FSP1.4" /LENGTH=95 /DNA_ID=CAMNT_0008362367 /DNA_START=815 /DNA_END=1098 /DNA_ORIENTATION=-